MTLRDDWSRALLLALIIIGVLLVAFAVFQYVRLTYAIGQNAAFIVQSQNAAVDPQSQSEALGLIASNEELRGMLGERNTAVIIGGVGLTVLALTWIARDWLAARRKAA
jgi:hypothetical protein